MSQNKGFTLVEMAIALVIVGLLVGSVLKGYGMTTNAKVKRLTADFNAIRTAHNAYIDRKGEYAGQVANGEIGSALAITDSTDDFFGVLALEGFLTSQNISPPKGIGSAFEVYYVADQTEADANNATIPGANQICATRVDGEIARGLDIRFDNGDPETGDFRAETAASTAETEYERGVRVTICLTL